MNTYLLYKTVLGGVLIYVGFLSSWQVEDILEEQTQTILVRIEYKCPIFMKWFLYFPALPMQLHTNPPSTQPDPQPGQHHLQWTCSCKRIWAEGGGFLFLWERWLQGWGQTGVRTGWRKCWHILPAWPGDKPGAATSTLSWLDLATVPWYWGEGPSDGDTLQVCL